MRKLKLSALALGAALALGVGAVGVLGAKEALGVSADSATVTPSQFTTVTSSADDQTISGVRFVVTNGTITGDQYRVFKNQTLTIYAPANSELTSVEMTCTAKDTAKYGPGCFAALDGYTYSGTKGTWTGTADSIALTASKDQVRITQFVIGYSSKQTDEPAIALSKSSLTFIENDAASEITVTPNAAFTADPTLSLGSVPNYVNVAITGLTLSVSPKAVGEEDITINAVHGSEQASATLHVEVLSKHGRVANDPFTVAEAREGIDGGLSTSEFFYVEGIVSEVVEYKSDYKSITYNISADGTTTADQLQVYSGKGLDGADFSSASDVKVGAEVVVCGKLKKHNETHEFDYNNYLVSYSYEEKTIDSISVEGTPVTQYVGQDFDATGLTFTINYSDSTTGELSANDVTWPTLAEGNNQTIVGTYGEHNVEVTGVNVVVDTFTTLTLSGDLTTKAYSLGGSWSASGLVATANYAGKGDTVVEAEYTFDPATPALMGETESGTLKVTATFDEVESNELTFTVSVASIPGALQSGRYFVFSENGALESRNYSNNASNVVDITTTKAWQFELVAENTYTIFNGEEYLKVTATNRGIRTSETAAQWTLTALTGDNAGKYQLVSNDGTDDRYLCNYNTETSSDWRCYKESSIGEMYILSIVEEKEVFANNLLESFTSGCQAAGTYDSEKMNWTGAATQFDTLSAANKALFKAAEADEEGSLMEQAVARYDYLVGKYGTEVFADFMSRNPAPIPNASGLSNGNTAETTSVMIVVVAAVALVSIASVVTVVVIKRRRMSR